MVNLEMQQSNTNEKKPKALTYFAKYHCNILNDLRIKIGCPNLFNDPFDSKLRINDNELTRLAKLFAMKEEQIKYSITRLECINILSLSGKSAFSMESGNMWGLYADKGNGVAFEFDYNELENRVSMSALKQFIRNYKLVDDDTQKKKDFIHDNINQEIINNLNANVIAVKECFKEIQEKDPNTPCDFREIEFNLDLTLENVKYNVDKLIELLDKSDNLASTSNIPSSLYEVSYTNDVSSLISIFERHLQNNSNDLVSQFMSTKNIIWQHENEYRVLYYDFANKIIHPINEMLRYSENKDYGEASKKLREAWAEQSKNCYIEFSKDVRYKARAFIRNEKLKEYGSYLVPYLPYPTKIYLGWNFKRYECDDCKNVEIAEFKQIKSFCKENKIPLMRLHDNKANYEQNEFEREEINL